MKKNFYKLIVFTVMLLAGTASQANAQCVMFAAGPFNNLGAAPCDAGAGCPVTEINAFEAFAAESYALTNVIMGGEYAFNLCNGPNAGSFDLDLAIVSPNGNVDAFGTDEDGCTITWTASEAGTYLIVINEVENCGGGPNVATPNGFPSVTCIANAVCPPAEPCSAGTLITTGEVDVCDLVQTFDFEITGDTIPTGGSLNLVATPGPNATGGLAAGFSLVGIANPNSYTSDLNGILPANTLPDLLGTWFFSGAVEDAMGNICATTTDTLTVNFGPDGVTCDSTVMNVTACDAGVLLTTGEVSVCDIAEAFEFTVATDTVPTGGSYAFSAAPLAGGLGGVATGFTITGIDTTNTFDSDLNGILTGNALEVLTGPWSFRGFVIDAAGNPCSTTVDSLIVFFGTESPAIDSISFNGFDELTANPSGGVAPYSYLWDDPAAQTTQTAVGLLPGTFTVIVSDANGCIGMGEETFEVSSTNSISTLNDFAISPNPSNGNFIVDLSFEQNSLIEIDVLDITGRVITKATQQGSSATFNFALEDAPAGMYFINVKVGQESMTQKIIVSK